MKKRLFIFCAFIAMICFSCIAISFAMEVNESEMTQEEEILKESEEPLAEGEEDLSDVEEPLADGEEAVIEGKKNIDENNDDVEITEEKEATAEEGNANNFKENIEEVVDDKVDKITENADNDETVLDDVVISSESECEEELNTEYEEVASASNVTIKINWLSNVYLDDAGMGGSYEANWKTYYVEKGDEFEIPDDIVSTLNYDNCNQEYTLEGFTTNNQEDEYWLYADYASGEKMYDTSFVATENIELWVVYEAKYEYISSITFEEDNIVYKKTNIPNLAIKDIVRVKTDAISEIEKTEILENYMYKKFGDEIIFYTKDAKYGKALTEEGVTEAINVK